MLSARRLLILRSLAQRGTVAATAEALGYTASAVSQQLSVLEREVGLPLLDRDGRSVRLTALAEALVAQTGSIVEALDAVDSIVHAGRTDIAGRFSIAAFPSAAPLVATAVSQLELQHPLLQVQTVDMEPDEAFVAVDRGDVDVAVAHDYGHDQRPADANFDRFSLFDEPLVIFSTALDSSRVLSDYADRSFASPFEANACGRAVRAACRMAGFEPHVMHRSNDFNVLLAHVAAGTSIALLPESALGRHELHVTSLDDELERRVFTLTRRARRDHPAIVAIREQLAGASQQMPTAR